MREIPVWVWFLAGGAMVVAIAVRWFLDRARVAAIDRVARETGMRRVDPSRLSLRDFAGIELFDLADGGSFRNVLQGKQGALDCDVFDFRFRIGTLLTALTSSSLLADAVIGYRKNRKPTFYNTTVVAFRIEGQSFPAFRLREKGLIDKAKSMLGTRNVELGERPGFSNRFVLQADDDARAREIFTPKLQDLLSKQGSHFCLDCTSRWLVAYHFTKVLPPETLTPLVRELARQLKR